MHLHVHDSNLLHLLQHKLSVQCLLKWFKSRTGLGMARPTASTWSFRQSLPSFHIKYTEVSKVFKTILFKNYISSIKKTNSYCRREKERERMRFRIICNSNWKILTNWHSEICNGCLEREHEPVHCTLYIQNNSFCFSHYQEEKNG